MMKRPFMTGLLCVAVSGCGTFGNFSGLGSVLGIEGAETEAKLPFRGRVSTRGEDVLDFSVSVVNEGAGLDEVRESVRFQGTKYCIANNGSSGIDWTLDPASDDWAFVQDGNSLIFTGRCVGR